MNPQKLLWVMTVGGLSIPSVALAGPYSPQAGQPGSDAIPANDPRFVAWATGVPELNRGPIDANDPSLGTATFGGPADALGPASGPASGADGVNGPTSVVSLGDGGSITLTFDRPITDGPGADFAVFENGFLVSDALAYLELAHVDVSSDGTTFTRFPSVSLTPNDAQTGTFGLLDATNLDGLAGKHVGGFGTPFDLNALAGSSGLDVSAVTHVRLTDVVGSIDATLGSRDSLGNLINDPFSTPFASGGFDLDAIGVIHQVPEPAAAGLIALGGLLALRRRWGRAAIAAAWLACTPLVTSAQTVADFSDHPLPPGSFVNNAGPSGGFTSGSALFNDRFTDFGSFTVWSGFALSTRNDTTTSGFGNQYSVFAPAGSVDGTFAVAYPRSVIDLPTGLTPVSVRLANTTYAALSMRDGDSFAKKFGGPNGTDPDFFSVTLTGYDGPNAAGDVTGSATLVLADFRPDDSADDYILSDFVTLDLSPLSGSGVPASVRLSFASSDVGAFGINTPTYVALDDLVLIPEPATLTAAGVIGTLLLRRRRRAVAGR